MNKISLYILLILLFLALSKSFSPSSQGAPYVVDERVFSNFFKGAPISVILVDSFTTGFLIKTYFHKYKIVYGFNQPEVMIVKTSQDFWEKNKKNIGMSLFRRSERKQIEGTTPLPPGSLYIGDLAYGHWKNTNSGAKSWKFHRAYRHFPHIFGWGKEFTPSKGFYTQMKIHRDQNKPFYGGNQEFGFEGTVTKQGFGNYKRDEINTKYSFKQVIDKYLFVPNWSNTKDKKAEASNE